jgi:CheY-like chemotaxis protein
VRLTPVGSIMRLTVTDTGKGIDSSYLPHAFEPFSQEDGSTTRAHEGIGLGLSIVRSLVELHGGTIRAASEGVGRGATFTVELPIIESPAVFAHAATGRAAVEPAPQTELPALGGVRVLVIDDQEYTRDLVTAIFDRTGAEVQVASSVREGLEKFGAISPHVVVCDLAMPEEDGFAFLRAVRALPASANATPVIALTAFGRPEDRQRVLAAGFNAYLKKPVDPQELASTALHLSRAGAIKERSQ